MTAETSHSETAEQRRQALAQAAYVRMGIPLATLVFAIVMGVFMGAAGVVLVLAAGALVGVIAVFWASIRTLFGETPLSGADAYALGAPRAEEERKQAVLRALKDLEFERSVGKISDADYKVLVSKYRAEAKHLLRVLDEESAPRRARVEGLVSKRLEKEGFLSTKAPKPEDMKAEEQDENAEQGEASEARPEHVCSQCGTQNDADAVFCKKCGARQKTEQVSESASKAEDGQEEEAS